MQILVYCLQNICSFFTDPFVLVVCSFDRISFHCVLTHPPYMLQTVNQFHNNFSTQYSLSADIEHIMLPIIRTNYSYKHTKTLAIGMMCGPFRYLQTVV
jgi:hypothetical protein